MLNVNDEMFEEQEIVVRNLTQKLKKNRDGIKKEDRTGTGKYARPYKALKIQTMNEIIKYACMGVRHGLMLNENLVLSADEIVKAQIHNIFILAFECQFDELNALLDGMHQEYLETCVFPAWNMLEGTGRF